MLTSFSHQSCTNRLPRLNRHEFEEVQLHIHLQQIQKNKWVDLLCLCYNLLIFLRRVQQKRLVEGQLSDLLQLLDKVHQEQLATLDSLQNELLEIVADQYKEVKLTNRFIDEWL